MAHQRRLPTRIRPESGNREDQWRKEEEGDASNGFLRKHGSDSINGVRGLVRGPLTRDIDRSLIGTFVKFGIIQNVLSIFRRLCSSS